MRSSSPQRAGVVLAALILVAAVANLNLAVANVALPDIGKAFNAGQTTLNLVAIGYSPASPPRSCIWGRSVTATGAR